MYSPEARRDRTAGAPWAAEARTWRGKRIRRPASGSRMHRDPGEEVAEEGVGDTSCRRGGRQERRQEPSWGAGQEEEDHSHRGVGRRSCLHSQEGAGRIRSPEEADPGGLKGRGHNSHIRSLGRGHRWRSRHRLPGDLRPRSGLGRGIQTWRKSPRKNKSGETVRFEIGNCGRPAGEGRGGVADRFKVGF